MKRSKTGHCPDSVISAQPPTTPPPPLPITVPNSASTVSIQQLPPPPPSDSDSNFSADERQLSAKKYTDKCVWCNKVKDEKRWRIDKCNRCGQRERKGHGPPDANWKCLECGSEKGGQYEGGKHDGPNGPRSLCAKCGHKYKKSIQPEHKMNSKEMNDNAKMLETITQIKKKIETLETVLNKNMNKIKKDNNRLASAEADRDKFYTENKSLRGIINKLKIKCPELFDNDEDEDEDDEENDDEENDDDENNDDDDENDDEENDDDDELEIIKSIMQT